MTGAPGLLPPPLAQRVPGPELMDAFDEIGGAELDETLRELRVINRRLGGHATSVRAVERLLERAGFRGSRLRIADVGGGGGDVALALADWARSRGLEVEVVVIDLHPETVAHARRVLGSTPGVCAEVGDLFALPEDGFDVVHAALFLHHFDGDEAVRALCAMRRAARVGVALNDLRRHWLPWTLIRWITGTFSRNRLIRHDAPLSVARAFTAADWTDLGRRAGLDLEWRRCWAWRWAVSGVAS